MHRQSLLTRMLPLLFQCALDGGVPPLTDNSSDRRGVTGPVGVQLANRWLSIRLELMGHSVVLCVAVFVTLVLDDAGLAGLALASALSIVGLANWATRQGTELEMGMNSVERMTEYLTYESEKPAIIPGNRCARRFTPQMVSQPAAPAPTSAVSSSTSLCATGIHSVGRTRTLLM